MKLNIQERDGLVLRVMTGAEEHVLDQRRS
jgi:hypothetical protein